jgi:hypothetical protein
MTRHFWAGASRVAAVALALLAVHARPAQAQNPMSIVNVGTGGALTAVPAVAPGGLPTSRWTLAPSQLWVFSPVANAAGAPVRITSATSGGLVVDVVGHVDADRFPLFLNAPIFVANNTAWPFQFWDVSVVKTSSGIFFQLRNIGTGKCLADTGVHGSGGIAVQEACESLDSRGLNSQGAVNLNQYWRLFDNTTRTFAP